VVVLGELNNVSYAILQGVWYDMAPYGRMAVSIVNYDFISNQCLAQEAYSVVLLRERESY